ncbi:hypothetical protein COE84_25425 [Bacillus wiedmannii]|uniref:AAA family ATPase n=1 Tax=Bacillus wiedmannii TaxID=1890302 RepID=UPI000BFBF67C|nr:SMC family ATPase [Bacillus wiedmannii]PHB08666.1 hypothetical protein COE84_25425 [Bacillus wiedmannii]
MKIEKIIIENFRIFNGHYKFDFSNKDIIIINGPNGNGKSTIFDSIQWCLTGEIPRYKGNDEWRKFNYLMNEKVFKTEGKQSMFVEVWLKTNKENTYRIKRSSEKESTGNLGKEKITINDKSLNLSKGTKEIREILTRDGLKNERSGKKNEINLPSFFASTQVLSQDALHNFIRADKPSERYKVINEILGIGKYGEDFERFIELARKTVEERKKELWDELEKPQAELNKLTIQISEKEELRLGIGEDSERELIISTEKLLEKIKRLKIVKIEIPNTILKLDEGIQENLIQIKQNVTQIKVHHEEIKLDVENSRELFLLAPQTFIDNTSSISHQLKALQDKQNRREKGKSIVNTRRIELETLKIKRKEYNKEKEYYNALKNKKTEIQLEIKNILSHVDVVKAIKNFGEKQVFIDTYQSYLKEKDIVKKALRYIEIDQKLINLKGKRLVDFDTAVECGKQLDERSEQLRVVSSKVKEIEGQVIEKKNSTLEELVRQVQELVLVKEQETICPVCGVNHKSNEKLNLAITEKIRVFSEKLSDLEKKLFELQATKSKFVEEIRLIKLKKEQKESEILGIEKNEGALRLNKEQLITEAPEIARYVTNSDTNKIYKQIEKFLSDYQLPFGMLNSLIEKEGIVSELESEELLKKQVIDEIKNKTQRWGKYLDLEEKEINLKIQKINDYINGTKEERLYLEQKRLELNQENNNLIEIWEKRIRKIGDFQREYENFTGDIAELDEMKEKSNARVKILTEVEADLRTHLANIHSFLRDDEVKQLTKKKDSIKIEVEKKEKVLKRYENFLDRELAGLKASHTLVNSELIGEYLSQHSEYINQLFMQISPHAVYRYVQLVPRGKNLYVVMTKNREDAQKLQELDEQELKQQFNASLKFSSGQSNVLALCIFLALNRSQKWTELKFLGIDDPFQNLDDINIFSFIDVISQIVSLQRKQLLISTHNEDFANLIRAKTGLTAEKLGNITFQAYNDEGASVKGNCVVKGEEGMGIN